jgi:hypothetical protein
MTDVAKWIRAGGFTVLGAVAGFLFSQSLAFYTFSQTLETTKKIEMIHLARELTKEFYGGGPESESYVKIRMAIERCEPLYNGYSDRGRFSNDEINRYLGFFDDLGFYYQEGALELRFVYQEFGAYIIEAYEYDELKNYIKEMQVQAKQKDSFVSFQAVAKAIEMKPKLKEQVEISRQGCGARK